MPGLRPVQVVSSILIKYWSNIPQLHHNTLSTADMKLLAVLLLSLLRLHRALSLPASPQASAPALWAADAFQVVDTGSQLWPWQTYKSSSALPPHIVIISTNEPLFEGLIFLDTAQGSPAAPGTRETAPIIVTDKGDLIWSGPTESVLNFRVQTYNGAPVLTYFQGNGTVGAAQVVGHAMEASTSSTPTTTSSRRFVPN